MHYTFRSSRHFNHGLLIFESNLTSSSLQWVSDVITEAMGAGTGNHEVCTFPVLRLTAFSSDI